MYAGAPIFAQELFFWSYHLRVCSSYCAASLAAGSYYRPCGPIESLFLLSPARILDVRAQLYSAELSYSYCMDHHLHQPRSSLLDYSKLPNYF